MDIHFTPSALAVDTEGHLLVAVDYSELKKTVSGNPFQTHDTSNFHPFFSWFYKRGEKAYAVSLENPYDTMVELTRVPAESCHPEIVYRPAELDYPGMFVSQAELEISEYYLAPDGKTALQGTVDLGRCAMLAPAVEGKDFLLADDALRTVYRYRVSEGGNLHDGVKVTNKGQYGVTEDANGTIWTVDDKLYGFREGRIVKTLNVPKDAHSIISDGENSYVIGRSKIYLVVAENM